MKLVLLGTGGYHPSDSRQTACIMVPDWGLVLDAGTAMYRARDLLSTETLDIFLTHAHLDHVIGLTYLFDILHEKQVQRVSVHGLQEHIQQIEAHLFAPALFPAHPPFQWCPLPEHVELRDGVRLSHFPLKHPGGSVGYRLDSASGSLAYVTDTTATEDADYLQHIEGVDLLIHECYFQDDQQELAELTGHSCATAVGRVAKAAGVDRLILVHVNPIAAEQGPHLLQTVRQVFPRAQLGVDRMHVEF